MADRPTLNHAEMVYRPGDRETARALFETMGFGVAEYDAFPWLVVNIDAAAGRGRDNVMYVNESTPAQQNFEASFAEVLAGNSELADKLERYRKIRRAHPQYVFHFGASVATHEDWAARVEALREANVTHDLLKGRIDMDVREPGVPGALGPLSQAFIYTDIISIGPLQVGGLLFDLQWAPPLGPDVGKIEFPDRLAMV